MKPLQGIRVLEFARVLAGPMAGQIMAELGAEVIKIERPGLGDESRVFEPKWPEGDSAYFTMFNRGKKSVTLDLKSPEGAEIARRLAATADVLVENFLPGTMAKFGLDAESLKAVNPGLVYISATGFGQTGPDARKPGYDTVFQALSGLTSLTGPADGPPSKAGLPLADLTSGLWIVIAALAGLQGRSTAGHGTHVDLAMMDVQLSLLSIPAARYFALGETPQRVGSAHHGRVPSNAYECAGGAWLQISASDQHWPALCEVLGLDALAADADLAANANRVARRAEVDAAISAACRTRDRADLRAALDARGVPSGEILSLSEAVTRPQAEARGNVVAVPRPGGGTVGGLRTPGVFDRWDNPEPLPAPELGADTEAVLSGDLGLDAEDLRRLREEGVL
ncbi:CoA transferase [Rhodobacterales bacterium HKCCE2091]|nr:CoA transferase [Rhodobacterales bacterium HKCCE2091]